MSALLTFRCVPFLAVAAASWPEPPAKPPLLERTAILAPEAHESVRAGLAWRPSAAATAEGIRGARLFVGGVEHRILEAAGPAPKGELRSLPDLLLLSPTGEVILARTGAAPAVLPGRGEAAVEELRLAVTATGDLAVGSGRLRLENGERISLGGASAKAAADDDPGCNLLVVIDEAGRKSFLCMTLPLCETFCHLLESPPGAFFCGCRG